MTVRLHYQAETAIPVEVEGITPVAVRDKSLHEIERMPVFHGNVRLPLAEFFKISGDPSDGVMRWEGDLAGVHWIGAKMTEGTIHIAGNGGRHLGSDMTGGAIDVDGDVGDWLGGEMHGGFIRIRGRAGNLVGAAYRGSRRGMTGGTILVDGDVGHEVGSIMRRGILAVGGNAGDFVGFNMLAGSILIFGDSGIRHGAGMRRGTLAFFSDNSPPLLPTFRHASRFRPVAIALLLRELRRHGFSVRDELFACDYDLYNGDLIDGGRGELWLKAPASGSSANG